VDGRAQALAAAERGLSEERQALTGERTATEARRLEVSAAERRLEEERAASEARRLEDAASGRALAAEREALDAARGEVEGREREVAAAERSLVKERDALAADLAREREALAATRVEVQRRTQSIADAERALAAERLALTALRDELDAQTRGIATSERTLAEERSRLAEELRLIEQQGALGVREQEAADAAELATPAEIQAVRELLERERRELADLRAGLEAGSRRLDGEPVSGGPEGGRAAGQAHATLVEGLTAAASSALRTPARRRGAIGAAAVALAAAVVLVLISRSSAGARAVAQPPLAATRPESGLVAARPVATPAEISSLDTAAGATPAGTGALVDAHAGVGAAVSTDAPADGAVTPVADDAAIGPDPGPRPPPVRRTLQTVDDLFDEAFSR
jgi:hypothetical protein